MGDIQIQVYPPEEAFCIQGHGRPQADVGYDTVGEDGNGEEPQKIKLLVDNIIVHEWDWKGAEGAPYETSITIAKAGEHLLSTLTPDQEKDMVTIIVKETTTTLKPRFRTPRDGDEFTVGQTIPVSIEIISAAKKER